ncbi:MAG: glycosyltransferase family 4 protein [Deltaproteobacteria bacterium]|nr:glycosyltransferase family 4 protein [Deltaproteobacteria bacterium]
MKIIFYRHALLSRGGDKMFLFYANNLAEKGHDVTLYCNTTASVFTISPAVHLKQVTWPGKMGTILFALLHNFGADVIVADIIPLAVTLSLRNSQCLYLAQDLDTSYYTSPLLIGLMRFLLRWGIGKKKIPTIAVSHALAEELRQLTGKAVRVICNGIDQAVFYRQPNAELIASKMGKKAILIHARTDHRKGFNLACQVVRVLNNQTLADLVIWTVGEQMTADIFKGVEHRDFGYVDEQQLRQIMSSANIFLYPSRHEGFGLFPLEAMACGCPVVTTSAVPYANHGENALVAQVEDCDTLAKHVLELLQNPSIYNHLSQNGKQFAQQKYALSESTQQFESTCIEEIKNDK